jgi:thiamine biosynthesis lipoprotein
MKKILSVFMLTAAFAGCSYFQTKPVKLEGLAQGTYYSITYYDKQNQQLGVEIDSLLQAFDLTASVYVPNSLISKINHNQPHELNQVFKDIFMKGQEVSRKTNGAFDMTVMPLVNVWGFGFQNREDVTQTMVDSLLAFVGYEHVRVSDNQVIKDDSRVMIDFNAIAQGFSVDLIASFLEQKGIHNYLIDIGGEVFAKGHKPGGEFWRVGIEKPTQHKDDARTLKAVLTLKNKALATSGSYRKYYEKNGMRYSHTINPQTGYPVNHSLLSVSVMAEDCMSADAYATAFMVMGLEKARDFLKENPELEAYFIYATPDGKISTWMTAGIRLYLDQEL